MRDTDLLGFMDEESESYTTTILQCQACGSEVEDDEELCCDEPEIETVSLDEDGGELEYEF